MSTTDLHTNSIIINANLNKAYETIPESFIPITNGLYIDGKINGKKINFLVDTGANISIMSLKQAKDLGIDYLIDHHYKGSVKGVNGTAKMIGRIHYLEIEFDKGVLVPCGFTIINSSTRAIIGLNTMMSHAANIDLKNKEITFSNSVKVKFNKIY